VIIDFKKKTLIEFEHFYFDIHLRKCHQYLIYQDNKEIGIFYFTSDTSFGKIDDIPFSIRVTKKALKRNTYLLSNLKNNKVIGNLEVSNWPIGKTLNSEIEIEGYKIFSWEVLETKSVYNPIYSETSSKFTGRLFNDVSYLTFKWEYLNLKEAIYAIEHLPINGEVHLADNENKLLILVGLFMCEKEVEKTVSEP
jgi:hypothetical protein